jgi:CO/xanthine dehydrogenase FAD-binding subunit
MLRPLQYIVPRSAEEAVALLAEKAPHAAPLAGGTDLVVDLKHDPRGIEVLVDVARIPEFRGIEETAEGLRIGSMVTFGEIMDSPVMREMCPQVCAASHTVGAVQTRHLGTVGGNLVTCVPSMDSGPSLMVLDAEVTVIGDDGYHRMPIEKFFVGPRKTILKRHELLVDIRIPKKNLGKPSDFIKFGLRKGQALSLVNVAASLYLSADGKKIVEPRIALGAVAPTPIYARKAEAFLEGKAPEDENFAAAAKMAVEETKPIDDFRASAKYRRHLVQTLTFRALQRSAEIAAERIKK